MQGYRKSCHVVFDVRVHLVWCTKYRYDVLSGDIAWRCRDLLREICSSLDIEIYSGKVGKDHVHMYMSIPPKHSIASVVQRLKGKSSRRLQDEYKSLKKRYWGQHLWARGYFVSTVGVVDDEMIRSYIEGQSRHHQDDEFEIDV